MNKATFEAYWRQHYPGILPINYLFKRLLTERWLRIYSLPGGQRYADTPTDWAELLHRHNTMINSLVSAGTTIYIVVNYIREGNALFREFDFENIGVFTDREAETVFQSFCAEVTWQSGALDALLTEVANDAVRAFIIGPDSLLSPYDGGMDIIFADAATRNNYHQQYSTWRSPRPDGL